MAVRKRTKQSRKPAPRKTPRRLRLPAGARPTQVEVHVDLDPARRGTFKGEVVHELELDRRRSSLELHAADLRVRGARLETANAAWSGEVLPHPESETVEVRFAEPIPAGPATLWLRFSGRLRDDLRGLYRAEADGRRFAFTQLAAAEARRFFPCFDEPAFKARFALSVTTAKEHTVLGNCPVAKVEPLRDGRKTVHFETTPPLSSYLLALAVGELEASPPTHCGDTEIRVWHAPGHAHLTEFALETARETLARLEAWFGIPYPYEKLDLVAVPDFEAGAMENAGAVFFRETLLLVDPERATRAERKRAAEVICHELAHMWYGNLVTMAWWDDLWLNEAFATWMAFQIVDGWKPEWGMWNDFQHARSAALAMDALRGTHPIYTPVRTPDEATENFDLITYEKGASVLRMLERYLGAETFRSGVRAYIREHQESNTVAADLWAALSDASGQDVEAIVGPWIEQPGFPLVHVRRNEGGGLRLSQERFGAEPDRKPGAERWPIPWVGRAGTGKGRSRTFRHLLRKKRDDLELPAADPSFVYGNADEGGFFRPFHDEEELDRIIGALPQLEAVERMGLVGHQWALAHAGRTTLDGFLRLALALGDETDPDVLIAAREPLGRSVEAARRSLGEPAAAALRSRIEAVFAPALEAAGLRGTDRDSELDCLRRAVLFSLVGGVAEQEALRAPARAACEAYLEHPTSIDPDLADPVVSLAAAHGDAKLFDRLLRASDEAGTPQERRRFLMALADFRDPALVNRTLSLCTGPRVATQDVAILLTRLLGNRHAREATWATMKRRWARIVRRLPPLLVTRPIEVTPALGTRSYRRDVAAFFREHPVPTGARAVRQALEQFDLELAFDGRASEALRRFLDLPG